MKIYQGEPLGAKINIKDDNGQWVTDLSDYNIEALLKDEYSRTVCEWSTARGSITIGTEPVADGGGVRGYASFGVAAASTTMMMGTYTLEVARVISDGRAIGVARDIVYVLPANIKNGVKR